jgi:uncharacterized membrane protein YqjE
MLTRPLPPWLPGALLMAVFGQILGAKLTNGGMSIGAAALMPLALIGAAWRLNRSPFDDAEAAARHNGTLQAYTWGVGAASMLGVYLLSGLKWQHGWQYGAGMALIALVALWFARQPRWLNTVALVVALQGMAAAIGLAVLAGSGKLASVKADWAANIIFVAGGVALAVLSVMAVGAHRRSQIGAQRGTPLPSARPQTRD